MEWLKMFTKQHFETLAQFIRESQLENKYLFAQDMAKLFQADNSKFQVKKFFKACGLILESA